MLKKIAILVLIFSVKGISAQTISMEWPAFAGKTYDFVIFQGSKKETVQQDTIPKDGKFLLKIPAKYAPYTGMSRWLLTGSENGGGIDMAIPGHDFSITCLSAQPNQENMIYKGFDPVNELNQLFGTQQKIIERYETMSKATQLYDKTYPLYAAFQKEKEQQAKDYQSFQEDLKKNPSYNARFLPIINLTKGIPYRLVDDANEKALLFNEYMTKEINFEDLYASGKWEEIIGSWVQVQKDVVNDKEKFAKDFKLISDRIKKPAQYTEFVGKTTFFLTSYGKDNYIDAIANTVVKSGKVTEYLGSMQVYIKAVEGMQAADLVITEQKGKEKPKTKTIKSADFAKGKYKKTLILFYQTDCGHCETVLNELIANYKEIAAKGVRIISIAGDTDQETFTKKAATFPWTDKYKDVEGMNGINFRNYAAVGTPMLFLMDKSGKIEAKVIHYKDLMEAIDKKK